MAKRNGSSPAQAKPKKAKQGKKSEAPIILQVTASETWRVEGNDFFSKAVALGVPSSRAEPLLQKALSAYFKADSSALSSVEHASAQKNYAQASKRLAVAQKSNGKSIEVIHASLKDAFKYYKKGRISGACMSKEWQAQLSAAQRVCFSFAKEYYFVGSKGKQRAQFWEENIVFLPNGMLKGEAFLLMAQSLYFQGVEDFQNEDYKSSLSLTKDCYYPLEEAEQVLQQTKETRILREDIFLLQAISESVQARVQGDTCLERLLKEEEDLSMTGVYMVLDLYRSAAVLTRGKEIELEAVAMSRIGRVYANVLKLKHRAKEYYLKSIELGLSLTPRIPEREAWFIEAKGFVSLMRFEDEQKEKRQWDNVRKQHIGDLKETIARLDAYYRNGEYEGLVRHIYEQHPPKNAAHKVFNASTPWDYMTSKKAIMKALCHYHPDKIDMEVHGAKWKVLCEEITKVLNQAYGEYKGM